MKNRKYIISLLIVVLSLLGLAGTACGQSAEETEAIRLIQQGMDAYQVGQYQVALQYFQRSLDLCKTLGYIK